MLHTLSTVLLFAAALAQASPPSNVIELEARNVQPAWLPTSLPTPPSAQIERPQWGHYTFSGSQFRRPCSYRSYTALGDSYSAGLNYGNGLLPICDGTTAPCNGGDVCLRNENSFPMLMQQAHNFSTFNNLACSGANTSDCNVNQVHSSTYGRPDLVTLTIGGDNNQAFLGLIVNCVYQRNPMLCGYAIQNAQYTVSTIDSYLTSLFNSILSTNWTFRRRVVVLGYPKLWSSDNNTECQNDALSAVPYEDRMAMNDLADAMNAALRNAANKFWGSFVYADADALFEGNRLCDDTDDPFFQFDFATAYLGVFHPTEEGQQQLFQAVEQAAGCAG